MQSVGIYGGTFDPIHFGHLNVAFELMEAHHLQQVWFCPARINPFKMDQPESLSIEQRMHMLKLALADIPQFRVLDVESKRAGPSYTFDTLQEVLLLPENIAAERQFYLLLGEDSISSFFDWHRVAEIVDLVPLLVASRSGEVSMPLSANPKVYSALKKGMTKTRKMDICSTYVRERLQQDLYCGHLVPAKVIDYIYAHRLYSIP